MEHKPGDLVVHPAHGVGHIVAIEEMEFVVKKQSLFYRVGFDKTTIWVQVQNDGGIRAITKKADLAHYRNILESPPVSLDRNFHIRQKELETRLQNRSFQILCEVVRDLNALSGEKVLNNYERNLFRRTSHSLKQEWAFSSGIPLEETTLLINEMLQRGSIK
jgi:CarD family transcriptional regulator